MQRKMEKHLFDAAEDSPELHFAVVVVVAAAAGFVVAAVVAPLIAAAALVVELVDSFAGSE
jgi:hypothetical protein